MAQFDTDGLDGLLLSLEEVADIPDDVLLEMLQAEGEIVAAAQERKIRATLHKTEGTGQLAGSITVTKKLRRNGCGPYLTVYPQGVREGGGATNAEVGFVNEYGAPGRNIDATQWMRKANAESEDAATDAAAKVYHGWIDSKDL